MLCTFSQYRPAREYFKGPEGETQVVDRVALCSDKNGNLCIKCIIRHTRRPEVRNFMLSTIFFLGAMFYNVNRVCLV